jgi:hypothetical protein
MFLDIFPLHDYLTIEAFQEGKCHGPEKSRETKEDEDQPQTAGILQQAEIIQEIRTKGGRYEMRQMRWIYVL